MTYIFLFKTLIFTIFFCGIAGDLMEETENKVLKFRADLDQIGVDFENFFYDLIMEWMKSYGKVTDPLGIYKDQKALSSVQDLFKQYTEQIKKLNLTPANPTTLPLKNNLQEIYLNNVVPKNTRIKRESNNIIQPSENITPTCDAKSKYERTLEQMHIQELKQEVDKLKNIVYLLKSQQKTISSLDEIISPMGEAHTKKLLNALRNNSSATSRENTNSIHEELSSLKHDLRQTIALLNATRAFLVAEENEGLSLKDEIKKLNIELEDMKLLIQKMYRLNNSTTVSNSKEILGIPVHLPKSLPVKSMDKSSQNINTDRNDDINPKARSSELDRLLNTFNKENEVPTELSKLQEILKQNRERENIKKLLQKVIENREKPSERDLFSDDTDLTNQLRRVLKALDKSQSRIVDDDVEEDLKRLETAINSLQSHDASKIESKVVDNDGLIKLLLIDLLERRDVEGKNDGTSHSISAGSLSFTSQQIADLRKRLDQIAGNGKYNFKYFVKYC